MKKWHTYILPIVFGVTLVIPSAAGWLMDEKVNDENENRAWAKKPVLVLNRLDPFPKKYEAYYNDHFPFRQELLNLNTKIKFDGFKISPHPENSLVGKNGWYFMSRKEKLIFEGKEDFTQEELQMLKGIWSYRKNYLDSLDIPFYWMIAPMKHYVYEEQLPFNLIPSIEDRRVEVLKEYLGEEMNMHIIDPLNEFREIKEQTKLYYQQDNHWNEQAGYLASRLFVDRARSHFPQLKDWDALNFNWIDSLKSGGSHQIMMGVNGFQEKEKWVDRSFMVREENYDIPLEEEFPYPGDFNHRFSVKDTEGQPKILVIRDSFAQQMMPFISASFSESVYVFDSWQYKLNKEIIEKVEPDIILFIGLETHIENIFADSLNMFKLAAY